jgi:P4 family phage/plasmid primase-like protien
MNTTSILSLLQGVTRNSNGWTAKCPAHDDDNASLSISEGANGRTLLHCHAGCVPEAICAALKIHTADLFPVKVKSRKGRFNIAMAYDYHDESGKLLFQVCRMEPKDFRQRRPDGNGGWIWKMDGIKKVLFRLPEILHDVQNGKLIYICEGEKDVLKMVEHGFSATCNPGGAKKWQDSYTETLRGAAVAIIADKDAPGRAHAALVAGKLHGGAKSVRVLELPDTDGKPVKDAFDFFAAGGHAGQIAGLVGATPEWTPDSVADTTETKPVANSVAANTPAQWFANKFPSLPDEHGAAILEETDKAGIVIAKDIGEDFLAATLGDKGSPDAPTVFVPTEVKFYTYLPGEGVFIFQREPVLLAHLSRLLLKCARDCRDGCETKTLEFRFRDAANLSGVLKKARGLLEVPHDYFASDLTKFIPCANGMLRLDDKILLPFSPAYKRRNKLAVRFDAAAKCPLFLDTLMRQALDDDDLDLLQRWCGLALIGENLAQKLLILTGTAGGGKGTFVRVLIGIIGQTNLASLRPQLLGERFELGRFLGKTLLYGADVPENFLNQRGASVLKSLTGYDPVTLEFKNSNESPAIFCKFNVIVTCNSRLTVHLEGDTDAWRRRLAIIEYHKPKPENVIADLDQQILRMEASGVLNWMLTGLDRLRADGWQLRLTASQQAAVDNLLLESEGHTVFVRECLMRDANGQLTVPDCFAAYVEFCNQHGWTALTKNKFGSLIGDVVVRQFGITARNDIQDASGKAQRGWKGIRCQ